jgi:hypothetical protein
LYCRSTVAAGGIELAWKMGARRIFLLGVDFYLLGGKHYANLDEQSPQYLRLGAEPERRNKYLDMLKEKLNKKGAYADRYPGSGIFNLSKNSAITVFEKVPEEYVFGN